MLKDAGILNIMKILWRMRSINKIWDCFTIRGKTSTLEQDFFVRDRESLIPGAVYVDFSWIWLIPNTAKFIQTALLNNRFEYCYYGYGSSYRKNDNRRILGIVFIL